MLTKFLAHMFLSLNLYALEIRPPHVHEINEIAALYYASWHNTFDTLPDKLNAKERTKEYCLKLWQENYHKCGSKYFMFIAVEEKKVVGVIFSGPLEIDDSLPAICRGYDSEIDKLYIHPDQKNRGIGSQLLKAAVNKLRSLGFKKTLILSFSINKPASKFYANKKDVFLIGHAYMQNNAMDLYGVELHEQH